MGMTAFEIFGVLKLDTKEFTDGLNKAEGQAQKSTSGFSKVGSMIGGGLATAAKVGVAAVSAATGAITAFSGAAISEATSFESAFTGVKKTVDATEEEYSQLASWIMDASTKMASSKEEIAATMEIAGQLGIRGTEGLEKFTETMIMLGDTTNLSAEEAASALAKFGNIAGVAAEDTDRIGSVIVDLGNNFATTEADIVAMSTRLASAGTIAGFSATDILALSTAMSSVGINAEAGGTAMSTIMTKIGRAVDEGVDPANEKLQLFAATAGMTSEEFAKAWKSKPTEALQGFVKGLDGVIDAGGNVTGILDDLGIKGIRETNTIKSLALASDNLTGAVDLANKAFEENNALQHEAEMRYQTTESMAIQTKEAFKNLQVTIGQELMPTYGEFLSFSKTAMDDIGKGLEAGGLTGMAESMGLAISDALNMITEKLPTAVEAGTKLLGALMQGMTKNIGNITDAGFQIVNYLMKSMVDATSSEGSSTVMQIIDTLMSGFTENLPGLLDMGAQILQNIIDGLTNDLPSLIAYTTEIVLDIANSLINNAPSLIDSGVQLIVALTQGLTQAMPELVPKVAEVILTVIQALTDNLPLLTECAVQLVLAIQLGMIQAAPQIVAAIPPIIGALIGAIFATIPQILGAVGQLFGAIFSTFGEYGGMLITLVAEKVSGLVTTFVEWLAQLIPQVGQKLSELVAAFQSWLAQLPQHTAYFVGAMVGKFLSFIINLISDLDNLWNKLITSVINFGQKFITEGPRIAQEFVSKMITIIQTLPSKLQQVWNNILTSVKNFGKSFVENAASLAKDFVAKLVEGFKAAKDKMSEVGKQIVEGLKEGIKKSWTMLADWIKELAAELIKGFKDNFKIKSPSRLFADEVGKYIPLGIAMGIEENAGSLYKSIDNLTSGVTTVDNPIRTSVEGLSRILGSASSNQNITVQVVLEGDADRLFRVMQSKANSNYRLTGNASMVTV